MRPQKGGSTPSSLMWVGKQLCLPADWGGGGGGPGTEVSMALLCSALEGGAAQPPGEPLCAIADPPARAMLGAVQLEARYRALLKWPKVTQSDPKESKRVKGGEGGGRDPAAAPRTARGAPGPGAASPGGRGSACPSPVPGMRNGPEPDRPDRPIPAPAQWWGTALPTPPKPRGRGSPVRPEPRSQRPHPHLRPVLRAPLLPAAAVRSRCVAVRFGSVPVRFGPRRGGSRSSGLDGTGGPSPPEPHRARNRGLPTPNAAGPRGGGASRGRKAAELRDSTSGGGGGAERRSGPQPGAPRSLRKPGVDPARAALHTRGAIPRV